MKKPTLLVAAVAAHGALLFGLVVSGIWHIDQLDPGRHTVNLAVLEPPAASGSPAAPAVQPKMIPKQHVTKDLVQPVKKLEVKIDTTPIDFTASTGPGNGLGSGSGSGDNPDGKDDDTGTCKGDGCAPTTAAPPPPPQPEIHIPPPVQTLPPMMLAGLRTSGNTQVSPPDTVKQAMLREDHTRVSGAFRVCLGTRGEIASVARVASTKYPAYDDTLVAAIRTWGYKPYTMNGTPVPACGMVTFIYSIK